MEADIGTICVSAEGEQGGTRRPHSPAPFSSSTLRWDFWSVTRRGRLNSWRVNPTWLYLRLLYVWYFRIMHPCEGLTVARSHLGFPANLSKKFSKTQKKFYKVIIVIFMGFKTEIIYFMTNLVTHKFYFISKLPLKKLRKVRKCFPALFKTLFDQIWGRTLYSHQNLSATRYF